MFISVSFPGHSLDEGDSQDICGKKEKMGGRLRKRRKPKKRPISWGSQERKPTIEKFPVSGAAKECLVNHN